MTEQENTTTKANAVHHQTKKAADMALAKRTISPDSHKAIHEGRISLEEARELGREGSPFAPAKKTISKDEKGQSCWCSCGSWTKPNRRWLPGHDQRAKGIIMRAVREGTLDELSDQLREYAAERDLIRQTQERMAAEERKRQERIARKAERQRMKEGEAAAKKTETKK